MSGYTVGPWVATKTTETSFTVHSIEGRPVAEIWLNSDSTEANAALVAAAPDMLAALRWFIDDIDGEDTNIVEFSENVERAREAIAKAEGR